MTTWPLIQRNKVEDSKINVHVQACAQSENQALAELAQKVRLPFLGPEARTNHKLTAFNAMGSPGVCLPNTQTSENG